MYDFSHLNKFETYEGDDSQQHSASPLKQKRRENFANYHVKRPELKMEVVTCSKCGGGGGGAIKPKNNFFIISLVVLLIFVNRK